MKNILLLTISNMKRNRFAVLMSIFGAIMLCMILHFMGGMVGDLSVANVSIGVIDYDKSILSEDFKNYMKNDLSYNLVEDLTYEKLSDKLINKDIAVIIEIPKGFYDKFASGNKDNIIVTPLDDYENIAYVQAYINNYLGSINILSHGAAGNKDIFDQMLAGYNHKNIELSQTTAETIDQNAYKSEQGFINSIGFFLMFVFTESMLVAFMILDDRQSGVYDRIQISPVKPLQYIIGSGIFGLVLSFIQVGAFCCYIHFKGNNSGIPLYVIALFMCLYALFTVCFSMAIAVVLKSKNSITTLLIGFATVGCILGGAYFPIDMAPQTLQNLAKLLPQYWFMDALRNIQVNISANILPDITILSLFSILSLLIGAVFFAQNYKKN